MPVSKRKIKPLIDDGLVSGYDDIRLPTLRGLKKRGILPEAIKKFVLTQGISKVESTVTFGLLEAANRKTLDPITKRYFFVTNPVELIVKRAPMIEKSIYLHPINKKLGARKINTGNTFYVPDEDIKKMKIGEIFRLKDLFNVRIKEKNKVIIAEYIGDELIYDSAKIQWTTEDYIKMNIFIPQLLFINGKYNLNSLNKIEGYAENSISEIKTGEIVQFERFGFVRIEKVKNQFVGFFTHK
jgi:glutamyl-tRNA synthetase